MLFIKRHIGDKAGNSIALITPHIGRYQSLALLTSESSTWQVCGSAHEQ